MTTQLSVKDTLKRNNAELYQAFLKGAEIDRLLKKRSQAIDKLLIDIWGEYSITSATLVAVGGYGREEMHPASDIDLLLLLSAEPDKKTEAMLTDFVTSLWDLGLEIGHSVRTIDECFEEASNDLTVITNLIESRYLCGNLPLFEQLHEKISSDKIWSSQEFFLLKVEEQSRRYKRYGDTAYRVEPNLKEGPGGLRDLQTISWIALREFGTHSLKKLSQYDLLNSEEYQALIKSRDFLWKVRFALHQLTGRKEDRLLFDHQRSLAHIFGYTNDENNQSIETFMQRYYRTITELERLNEILLGLLREQVLQTNKITPVIINEYYNHVDGYLGLAQKDLFKKYPHTLLEVFHIMQFVPEVRGLTPVTLRELKRHLHLIDEDFRNNEHNKQLFINIMSEPQGITFALRRMNRYGVLAAYIPAFQNIVGRMQYDLFHAYTVDDHTLNVVRNIRRMGTPQAAEEYPLCSKVFKNIQIPMILYLAALFHDIAKGRGGSHSELGAIDALAFCLSHGINQYDSETVSWLVRNHLEMSSIAQRQDITDPALIQDFADKVVVLPRLDYLYLLTISDIKGTNPTLLNSWKHSLIKDLYHATKKQLQSIRGVTKNSDELSEHKKKAVITQLQRQGVSKARIETFWKRFDQRYVLQHTVESMTWHISEILNAEKSRDNNLPGNNDNGPIIRLQSHEKNNSSQLFIYSKDKEKLFIRITSALEQQNLNIVAARMNSSDDGYVIDTLNILNANNEIIERPEEQIQLILALQKNLSNDQMAYDFNQYRTPRKLKHFDVPSTVHFEQDEKHKQTVITITTGDSIGLLTRISIIFDEQNLNIHDARIATLGETAEDIFHTTTRGGHMVTDPELQEKIRQAIILKLQAGS